jgi:predicted PurR-regulated permease PerM
MEFWEIIALICCLIFVGFIFNKIVDLIKTWINRKKPTYDQEKFEKLAKAFIQYKKRSERRVKKLETSIHRIEPESSAATRQLSQDTPRNETIEVESKPAEKRAKTSSGKMKNMLRE